MREEFQTHFHQRQGKVIKTLFVNTDLEIKLPPTLNLGVHEICESVICGCAENEQ